MDRTELVQSRMLCRRAGDSGASGKCTVVRLIYSSLPPLCLAANLNIQLKLCVKMYFTTCRRLSEFSWEMELIPSIVPQSGKAT
jgi:hypothetical protein